ncbi:phage head closure protein [Paenibacillus lupini]|uniref:phage head closure protein n=1 Tax=Paenibacillus lupini TaxID=1450204 RepID=UPI001420503A|nr:phage head closure protein [Paenibacillus lupini]NIK24202.1 SPP1 family predicted phage head-tail adaptor [Paenibacillus lupini]
MMWRDVVKLFSLSLVGTDNQSVAETDRTVFANKKSVARSEFYQAFANNLKPTIIFEVRSVEYEGEQKLQHNGVDYIILRTYSRNDETIELTCQSVNDVQTNLARLQNIVEIWHHITGTNNMGEMQPVERLLFTVPARVEQNGGGSNSSDGITETTNYVSVTMVYREGIRPDMFLKIDGNRYDIRFIEDPLNRHETLIISAERVTP